MKKLIYVIILFTLFQNGCVIVNRYRRVRNRENLSSLKIGMTKKQALETMDSMPMVTEAYQSQGREYLFYDVNLRGYRLIPLVFQDGRLIGWGGDYYGKDIKVRDRSLFKVKIKKDVKQDININLSPTTNKAP